MHEDTSDTSSRITSVLNGIRSGRLTSRSAWLAIFLTVLMVASLPAMALAGGTAAASGGSSAGSLDAGPLATAGSGSTADTLDSGGAESLDITTSSTVQSSSAGGENGTVYVGSDDDNLHAVDAESGNEKWTYSSLTIESSPTVVNGTVYVGSNNDGLHAVDATSGSGEWTFWTGGNIYSSPTVVDGTVYVGSEDSNLYAVDAESGEEEWTYSTGGEVTSSPTVADGTVYIGSGDNDLHAVDATSGSGEWTYSTGGFVESSPTVAGDTVYVGSQDSKLHAVDAESGSGEWNYSAGGEIDSSPTVSGGTVYVGSWDDNLHAINAITGEEEWTYPTGWISDSSPTVGDGTVYVGDGGDSTLYAVDAESGDGEWTYSAGSDIYSSPTYVSPGSDHSDGSRVRLQTLGHIGNVTAPEPPAGNVVVDQDGNPVANATVEAWGANEIDINESKLKELGIEADSAKDLISELEDSAPIEWEEFTSDFASGRLLDAEAWADQQENAGAYYPLVHQQSDWSLGKWSSTISSNVDDPQVVLDDDEGVVLSVWDPAQSGDWLSNQIDNSFPGKVVRDGEPVVVEMLGPGNDEVIETETYEPNHVYKTSGTNLFGQEEIPVVRTHLPKGVYRVYPESSPQASYVFTVGSPSEIASGFVTDLRNRHGELTDRVNDLRELQNESIVVRESTTTNENGTFDLDIDADTYSAQAFKGPPALMDAMEEIRGDDYDPEDPPTLEDLSIDDLRTYQDALDYNGTFYLPANVDTYDRNETNITIETYRTPNIPWGNMSRYDNLRDWIDDQILDPRPPCEVLGGLCDEYDQPPDEWSRDRLEDAYENYRGLIQALPPVEEAYFERSDYDEWQDAGDLTDDQLVEEVVHMQIALTGADIGDIELPDPGDNPFSIEDGELFAEIPIPDVIDPETIAPEIHWSDGTSEAIPEEYWSVESGSIVPGFGGNTLVIDGFPIGEDDPAQFDIRILGAGDDGDTIIDDRLPGIENPAWGGTVPDVRAINLNTISPGPDEQVQMTLRDSEGAKFARIDAAEAWDADGRPINTTVTDDHRIRWETNGTGTHAVRLTLLDQTGEKFVYTFPIVAHEEALNSPPTVRGHSAVGDQLFAVVGEGLIDGEIRTADDSVAISAIVPEEEIPSTIHLKVDRVMESTASQVDVRVLEGPGEETINSHIEVVMHLDNDFGDGEGLAWRGSPGFLGEPLTWDDGTRYGEIMDRSSDDVSKTIIRTYTEGDGSLTITANPDPGRWDRLEHWISTKVPRFNFDFDWLPLLNAISSLMMGFGSAALFRRRRNAV